MNPLPLWFLSCWNRSLKRGWESQEGDECTVLEIKISNCIEISKVNPTAELCYRSPLMERNKSHRCSYVPSLTKVLKTTLYFHKSVTNKNTLKVQPLFHVWEQSSTSIQRISCCFPIYCLLPCLKFHCTPSFYGTRVIFPSLCTVSFPGSTGALDYVSLILTAVKSPKQV